MRRLKRFAQLSSAERGLLIGAWLMVAVTRGFLWLLPLDSIRSLLRSSAGGSIAPSPLNVIRAIRTASRYVPRATCLTQALAAQSLLARFGHDSRIEIGVAKDLEGSFQAHAWLVHNDCVVLGGAEAGRYTPLLAFGERA